MEIEECPTWPETRKSTCTSATAATTATSAPTLCVPASVVVDDDDEDGDDSVDPYKNEDDVL